jgi:hypothetical protein
MKEKKFIGLKASSSKENTSIKEDCDSNEDSSNEEEMGVFVRIYNRYVKKNGMKHSDKNLINFRKAQRKGADFGNEEKVLSFYGHIEIKSDIWIENIIKNFIIWIEQIISGSSWNLNQEKFSCTWQHTSLQNNRKIYPKENKMREILCLESLMLDPDLVQLAFWMNKGVCKGISNMFSLGWGTIRTYL